MPQAASAQTARAAFLAEAAQLSPAGRRALAVALTERRSSSSSGCRGPPPSGWRRRLPGLWPTLAALTAVLYAVAFGLNEFSLTKPCWYSAGEFLSDAVRYPANCQRICAGLSAVPTEPGNISRGRFQELYAYTGRPVLVKGAAADWPARGRWNLTYFRDLYNSQPKSYAAQERRARYLPFRIELMSLREALNMPEERQKLPYYFGWSNLDHRVHNELKKDYEWPRYLPLGSQGSVLDWIFIGGASFGAPVHLDHILRPSWQAQVTGKKVWEIHPPSECSSVCKPLNVTMEPGDIFNVDTNLWYHATYVYPGEYSITIGAEYD